MSALVIEPLPESLLARLARSAAKHQRTLAQEAVALLMEATANEPAPEPDAPYFANRQVLPDFQRMQEAGAFAMKPGDRDVTDLISEERDGR